MNRCQAIWLLVCCALLLPVAALGQGPTCFMTITPNNGTVPLPVTASGSCAQGANPIIAVTIDWGDGTPFSVEANPASFSDTHTYQTAGNFTAVVTATDSAQQTGTFPAAVSAAAATGPSCTLGVNPKNGTAPLPVDANGNCQAGTNPLQTVTLNWDDGTIVNEPAGAFTDSHTFGAAGSYQVTLTAMDSGGLSDSVTKTVNVNSPQPQAPTCTLTLSSNSGGVPLTLAASGSCSDPQGALTSIVLDWDDGNQTNIPVTNGAQTVFGPIPHQYTSQGTFHPTVHATNSFSLTGSASKTVTVGPPVNLPPSCTLSANPNSGQVPVTVTATANCVDPENDISRVVFQFGDGYYQAGSGGQSAAAHTFVNAGNFSVQVVATDSGGNTAAAQQNVSLSDNPPVFVAIGSGSVKQFAKDGTPQTTLKTNQGGSTTGMTLDSLLNLYVTDFTANAVSRFGGHGGLIGNFGSGYNCEPESIVFDGAGHAYVGETGCSKAVLKYDAYGNLMSTFAVATETQGSDWIDLAPDGCTLYYTSQGTTVLRYDVCGGKQLPTFATGLKTGLGVRVLPDNSVLVAEKADIVRLDTSGHIVRTYDSAGHDCWVSVALDSGGSSFWALDYCSSVVARFEIASGNQISTFNTGTAANTAFGVYTRGPSGPAAPAGPLTGPAQGVTVAAGQKATYNLTFNPNFGSSGTFTFSCANLPLGANCSFTPASLTASAGATPVTLTVTTSGGTASLHPANVILYAMWLPMIGAVLFSAAAPAGERKRRWRAALIIGVLLTCTLFLFACGGGSGSSSSGGGGGGGGGGGSTNPPTPGTGTPPGTYTFTATASSGSSQSSTTLILTVQ